MCKLHSDINTVKTAVLLCELNRHITDFIRVLLQVHELMQRVLPEMRAQCGLIQHVLAALLMAHTCKLVFFYRVYDNTPYVCTKNFRRLGCSTGSGGGRKRHTQQ